MADREPVTLEDVLTPEQLEEFKQAIEDDNVEVFRTFFESKEFPLLPEDEFKEIPLTFYVLGAHSENDYRVKSSYRPNIFKYLLDHGANLDFLTGNTVVSLLSETFFPGDDFTIDVWTTLAANAAVLGNLPALKLLYERGADFSILPEKEVEDGWESIPGETIQYFVEKKLGKLNDDIKLRMEMIPAYERWQAQGHTVYGGLNLVKETKERLNEFIKQRIELARVLRWIRYITTEENIPAYRTTARNRKAYANVLLRAPGLGRLEKNYLMSFVPKPAKFAVVPEHGLKRVNTSLFQEPPENGLKRVNTSLFQGGKTRRRRARKLRSRRRRN
jgi:hypothetical protein